MSELWNLPRLNLFDDLQPETMELVMSIVTVRQFRRQSIIFRPGDPGNRFCFLHHGRVKTYRLSEQGHEKIMHIFLPGDAFGDLLFGAPGGELPWAETLDDVVISFMDELAFKRFMVELPDLCLNIFRYMAAHHAADMRRLESFIHTDASHRLVVTLLELGDRLGQSEAEQFELTSFTHEDLANMIGVVRSTASELIGQLRQAGVVSNRGRCLIIHRRAAQHFLQQDNKTGWA